MNILIADDEQSSRSSVADFLRELGHQVVECPDGVEALEIFKNEEFHLVLSDIRMPRMSGTELLRNIRNLPGGNKTAIILFTGHGNLESAIDALRAGAYDYLLKPINIEELAALTERIAEYQALLSENMILTKKFNDQVMAATEETRMELTRFKEAYYKTTGPGNTVIHSRIMQRIMQQVQKLHEDRDIPVLIEGETGTGKEVIARHLHSGSGNVLAPFLDLNCAAITPGLFESELFGYEPGTFTGGLPKGQKGKLDLAQGGTLFLDEIGEISVDLQAKLLRVIQEKEYYRVGGLKKIKADLRLVCASNLDLEEMVSRGSFRRDLFYRLNIGRIYLPPLRERKEDILPLARTFLDHFAKEKGKQLRKLSPEAEELLLAYNWPGNVRELKNTMEWVVLMCDDSEVKPAHLSKLQQEQNPDLILASFNNIINHRDFRLPPQGLPLDEYTNQIILEAMKLNKGNKTKTAQYLGISRRSLYSRLEKIKLEMNG